MASRIPLLIEDAASAAEFVSAQIYQQHPEYLERYGEKGRNACRSDIASHLSYIDGAVETGSAEAFVDYLRWLRSVLLARGVEENSLLESVCLLGEYFKTRLDEADNLLLQGILDASVAALTAPAIEAAVPAYLTWQPSPSPQTATLAEHLATGNVGAVREIVAQTASETPGYVDLAVHLFQPSLYRIGSLWQQNRLSVAQEHLATAIVQNQLAQLYAAAGFARPLGRQALFACIEGNHHAIGLRMISDAFELAGWQVQHFGANLPLRALVKQVDETRPALVGLSASLAAQLPALRETIAVLRAEFGSHCPEILIGGLATNQTESICRSMQADIWAPSADRLFSAGSVMAAGAAGVQ